MRKMKQNKKQLIKSVCTVFFAVVCTCGMLTGCGASEETMSSDAAYTESYDNFDDYGLGSYNADVEYEETQEVQESASATENKSASEDAGESAVDTPATAKIDNSAQKIIRTYDYEYETEKFDSAYAYLKEQVGVYDGYIASSDLIEYETSSSYRKLYLTAKIPADKCVEFVSGLGRLGAVVKQSESAQDVTLQYSDTESRIASLETEQERLLALLDKADSLETIITLEDRLTEVRYELENYQSQKKLYDNLINYSTVDIVLKEVNYTVEVDDSTFFSRVKSGLERSLRDIGESFVRFAEWFVINLPYFLIWGFVIFGIVKLIRFFVKRGKAKRLKKQEMKQQRIQQMQEQYKKAQQMQEQSSSAQREQEQNSKPNVNPVTSDDKK